MLGPRPTCLNINGGHMCLLNRGHDGPHECFDACQVSWTDDDRKERDD